MINIDFDKPVIPEDHILAITPGDIDDQYVVSSERERFNLFFVLLTTFHACKDGNKMVFGRTYGLFALLLSICCPNSPWFRGTRLTLCQTGTEIKSLTLLYTMV